MKKIIKNILLILTIILIQGCYKDKGSYDYKEINEVEIELPEVMEVRFPKRDSLLVEIVPKLSQTQVEDNSNLSFSWSIISIGSIKEISKNQICSLYVKPSDKDMSLRLTVTDNTLGTEWYKEMKLKEIPPYNSTWFVLQDVNGKSVLGAVDGVDKGKGVAILDIYKDETGGSLDKLGKPVELATNISYGTSLGAFAMLFGRSNPERVVMVAGENNIEILNLKNLGSIWSGGIDNLFRCVNPIPKKVSKILFHDDNSGEAIINDNKLYWANFDGYSLYRTVKDVDDKPFTSSKMNIGYLKEKGFIIYDGLKNKFSFCRPTAAAMNFEQSINTPVILSQKAAEDSPNLKLEPIGSNDQQNKFNPDNITGVDRMIDILRVDDYTYACALGEGNKILIYRFNCAGWDGNETARCDGFYEIDMPSEITNTSEISFAGSIVNTKTVFMAVENQVFKIDLGKAVPKILSIYKNDTPNLKITKMKFRYGEMYYDKKFYEVLCVAVDYGDNTGGFIELNLNSAGDVIRGEGSTYEYKGFGKIVDIIYSFK